MIVDPAEQGSEGWYQARCGVVTASEFSKVLAKGRGKEPSKVRATYMHELANEILTCRPILDGFESPWMARGKEVEAQARAYYEITTGQELESVGVIYKDESRRVGCSCDALGVDAGGLELKSPKIQTHLSYILAGDKVPTEYVPQVQGCMYVAGRDWWDFMSFHPEAYRPGHIVRVERDEVFQKRLESALAEFIEELDALVMRLKEAA